MSNIRIVTDDVAITALNAVCDDKHSQLVSATLVSHAQQLIKAVTAVFMTNGNKSFKVNANGVNYYLSNARRGGAQVSVSLSRVNAEGYAHTWVHPLVGNPQENTGDWFYILCTEGEDLPTKFAERLNLAISWPVQPEWAQYLMRIGMNEGLISQPVCFGPDFKIALCVEKSSKAVSWKELIEEGLKSREIRL